MNAQPGLEELCRLTERVDFRLLFEVAPHVCLVLSPQFHIVAVSDGYLRATMTQRDEIVGRGIFDVFPDNPDDPHADGVRNLTASLKFVVQNCVPHRMEIQKYDIRRPESEGGQFEEHYWDPVNIPVLSSDGNLLYIIHSAEDVTNEVRLKKEARCHEKVVNQLRDRGTQIEESFRLLVEGVKDYAIFMLDASGKIVSWNTGAERLHGYRRDDILGQQLECFYRPDDVENNLPGRHLQKACKSGRFEGEVWLRRKDRSEFCAIVVICPVLDEMRKLIGFSQITRDATETKRAEETARRLIEEEAARKAAEEHADIIMQQREKLRVTMDALIQAQKMEAVGQLAGGIAHDFNNLLTVILGYCNLILKNLKPDDPFRFSIDSIAEAGERASALTSQLLAFSRQSVMEPKVLDLNEVVRKTERLLGRLIGEDIQLEVKLDPDLHRIKFDPGQMGQVIMNLAINARDAMPKGGRFTIETHNIDLSADCAQVHPDAVPGPHVKLTITDTGTGMSPEILARIFEPFFTTKGVGQGTGLGLAVVHGIVKQSGGFLAVSSQPDLGSCFKIFLPVVDEELPTPATTASDDDLNGTETILMVEDEEGVRMMATMVLESYGYHVMTAGNGVEALKLADQCGDCIDLLLTDVVMPEMGGRDLAEKLCARYPKLKVLFSSGYTNDAVVRQGLSQDEIAFLQKPYDPFALVGKIRNLLDGR